MCLVSLQLNKRHPVPTLPTTVLTQSLSHPLPSAAPLQVCLCFPPSPSPNPNPTPWLQVEPSLKPSALIRGEKVLGRADCGPSATFRWIFLDCGFSASKLQSKRALGLRPAWQVIGFWLQCKSLPQMPLSAEEAVSFLDLSVSWAGVWLALVTPWSLSWVSE